MNNQQQYPIAIIGAGPAGLFAARELAQAGHEVVLFNRDVKPGGLAEYGIYPNKYKMKEGLRKQFRQILSLPNIHYYGNVTIGQKEPITLDTIRQLGFQAILVTVGAQGTKWQGLPGEDLADVYHAKDLVFHYNRLPPFSRRSFPIGKRVAVVGVGNVMVDVAHWIIRTCQADELIALARRGPASVKFTKKEFEYIAANLDVAALDAEFARCAVAMNEIDQDIEAAKEYILSTLPKAQPATTTTKFRFRFLSSVKEIVGDAEGRVLGIELENNQLDIRADGRSQSQSLGTTEFLPIDTLIFAIGDTVDEQFGLPVSWNAFVKNDTPRFPINELSYEITDPEGEIETADIFVAGWAREASSGLVGIARKDGINGAKAVLAYLDQKEEISIPTEKLLLNLETLLAQADIHFVTTQMWQRLETHEQTKAAELGAPEFKYGSNEDMLDLLKQ